MILTFAPIWILVSIENHKYHIWRKKISKKIVATKKKTKGCWYQKRYLSKNNPGHLKGAGSLYQLRQAIPEDS